MAKPASFNQWLKMQTQPGGLYTDLARAWETRRGRLTRAAVEERAAVEYHAPDGTGARAYDAYLAAIGASDLGATP